MISSTVGHQQQHLIWFKELTIAVIVFIPTPNKPTASMASSSLLSSKCTSNSSSQLWKHDVFISFRGKDTRKNFVDHLYSALVQKGIHTYKDDITLPRGKAIGPALLKAIEESQIAIIVFSKNYADSPWCLEELACIMKCMDERGQVVMPIFYGVNPSIVRKQKRKYGEAFSKHELENNTKLVESWRKALMAAANLSGWEPKYIDNGYESKVIKKIVNTISKRLFPLISNVNKDLIGIGSRLQDLKSHLEIGSGGVKMVGIWGGGGAGKSTLASSAYMELSREFEGHCLVENIREESSKYDIRKLQEKILLVASNTKVVVHSVEEGRCMIKSRLCRKNVLIVLDDVNGLDQLKALAGSHDWFGEGSRIIITTRDENLLTTHKVDTIYRVRLLSPCEAVQLFLRHAYREHEPVEDYDMLSLDVVSYAGGLPLALEILGSFLYDKDKDEWIDALEKLKDIPNDSIMDKLRISYDGLQPDEKQLFLDIACFFRRKKTDQTMNILAACGFHPVIGVKVLIQKALISITDGRFDMHDLVQEMARYIVRRKNLHNPEKHSRVWRDEEIDNMCLGEATEENNKIKALMYEGSSSLFPELVAKMKKLRLLYVPFYYHKLDEGPNYLSNELRFIHWRRYPASPFPVNFQATNLVGLQLDYSLQKELWTGYKFVPHLKELYLNFADNLLRTPDFGGLPRLEKFSLCFCRNLEEIHPSLGRHGSLSYLNVQGCHKLKRFPTIFRMEKLEALKISLCSQLHDFPEIQAKMGSLAKLSLKEIPIEVLPSSIGQYCTNLISLKLVECSNLETIEVNFRFLKRLRRLKFVGSTRLKKLPEKLFDVGCLQEIRLPDRRRSLSPENFMGWEMPDLPRITGSLNLDWCKLVDGDFFCDIGEAINLRQLYLNGNEFLRMNLSSDHRYLSS